MKIYKLLFGLSLLLFAFQPVLFGQSKTVTKKEYDSIRETAQKKTDRKIRRETVSKIRYFSKKQPAEPAKIQSKTTIIEEFLPPGKQKRLITESTKNAVIKTELIYIGDLEYRKEDQTEWKTRNLKGGDGSGRSVGFTAVEEEEDKTESYSVEEQKLNGEVYKVLTSSVVNEAQPSFRENKIWIDKDGLIYRQEDKLSLYKIENLIVESVTAYDYKVKNITIEAPVK